MAAKTTDEYLFVIFCWRQFTWRVNADDAIANILKLKSINIGRTGLKRISYWLSSDRQNTTHIKVKFLETLKRPLSKSSKVINITIFTVQGHWNALESNFTIVENSFKI